MIPLLTLAGVPIHTAVGTCLAFIAFASLAGIIQHIRQGSIDPVLAATVTLPAALMANVGARFSNLLPAVVLHILFSFLLVGIFVMYCFSPASRAPRVDQDKDAASAVPRRWYAFPRQRLVADTPYTYELHVIRAVLSGLATGTLTGFFGIGGGVLLVPLMVVFLHVPLRVTIGTSLAVFLLPALVGTMTHWRLGHVDLQLWVPLVVAGILGSQLGARCVVYVAPELLKRCFLLLVALGALYMFMKGLLG